MRADPLLPAALRPRASLVAIGALLCACGGGDGDLAPLRLRHTPPVERLAPAQLRAVSMECEKYPPRQAFRGRYEAAYCQAAIDAWGDSPLQLVIIPAAAAPAAPVTR